MPKIHLSGSVYSAPPSIAGWKWLPYTNKTYLNTLNRAIKTIDSKIKKSSSCDKSFRKLPGGKTFLQIWNDNNVWVSFDPDKGGSKWGVTLSRQHISITAYTLAMGHWATAATLIHELAHVNGAPGTNTQAEDVLLSCMLKSLHDPRIIGQIIRSTVLQQEMTA